MDSSSDTSEQLTLEELCTATGLSARNIRFYTTRGLVPPPAKHGRAAVYGPEHLARFELLKDLRSHGLTLAAIERYIADIPQAASSAEIALHRATLQPFVVEEPIVVTRRGINERAGHPLAEADLQRLVRLGAVQELPGGRFTLREGRFRSGLRLIELNVPEDLVAACEEVYRRHSAEMADELGHLFRDLLWPAYKAHDLDAEQMVGMVDDFQQASITSLVEAFGDAITAARKAEVDRRTTATRAG